MNKSFKKYLLKSMKFSSTGQKIKTKTKKKLLSYLLISASLQNFHSRKKENHHIKHVDKTDEGMYKYGIFLARC